MHKIYQAFFFIIIALFTQTALTAQTPLDSIAISKDTSKTIVAGQATTDTIPVSVNRDHDVTGQNTRDTTPVSVNISQSPLTPQITPDTIPASVDVALEQIF